MRLTVEKSLGSSNLSALTDALIEQFPALAGVPVPGEPGGLATIRVGYDEENGVVIVEAPDSAQRIRSQMIELIEQFAPPAVPPVPPETSVLEELYAKADAWLAGDEAPTVPEIGVALGALLKRDAARRRG